MKGKANRGRAVNGGFSGDPQGSTWLEPFARDVRGRIQRWADLQFDHLVVAPAALHQLLMRALLDDPAVLQHDDAGLQIFAFVLAGGIDTWAEEVDASLTRY